MLDRLELLKEQAKQIEQFGTKFVKDDLGLKFGDFFVSSKGTGRFAFYMENQDYRFFISKSKLNSEIPFDYSTNPSLPLFRAFQQVLKWSVENQ